MRILLILVFFWINKAINIVVDKHGDNKLGGALKFCYNIGIKDSMGGRKMARKLIGIDLDHTTLNEAGMISKYTRETLQAAQAEGHIISIITGRPPRLTNAIYQELGLHSPMINFNGALGAIPNQNWRDAYSHQVQRTIVFDLLEQAGDLGVDLVIAEQNQQAWSQQFGVKKLNQKFFPQDNKLKGQLNKANLKTDVNAILLHAIDASKQTEIQNWIQTRYGKENVNVKIWGGDAPVLEVAPAGVAKDTGLQVLQRSYQIAKDDVYAFGDEMNDLEMIEYAGHGVVMQNGNSELKKVANDVTPYTNEQDGLARYIKTIL